MTFYFFCILILLSIIDMKELRIPNIIVLPAIALGLVYSPGNWPWALGMFILGTVMFYAHLMAGGDVKLLAMGGAFFGWVVFPSYLISRLLLWVYRKWRAVTSPLPYTPFFFLSSAITIGISKLIEQSLCLPPLTAGGM